MKPKRGIHVAEVFGIEIRLDYSWFILFFLISWSFVAVILPALYPELRQSGIILLGFISTFLLFLSVLAHEFGHSLYAKSQGLSVHSITLFIFGGAAEVEDESQSPKQEFIMASLGPAISIVLGFVFGALWLLGIAINYLPFVVVGSLLAILNIVLAIFNLVPGFPLDGGRILRAVAWRATGSLEEATRIAANGGKIFGYTLIALGLLRFITGNFIGGLWLILIGFFLRQAAELSYQQMIIRSLLADLPVSQFLSRDFTEISPGMLARDFIDQYVLPRGETAFPVKLGRGKPFAMIFLDDIQGIAPDTPIRDAATPVEALTLQSSAQEAWQLMTDPKISELPVVRGGQLIGIVQRDQIQAYLNANLWIRSKR